MQQRDREGEKMGILSWASPAEQVNLSWASPAEQEGLYRFVAPLLHPADIMKSEEIRVVRADPPLPFSNAVSHTIVVDSVSQGCQLSLELFFSMLVVSPLRRSKYLGTIRWPLPAVYNIPSLRLPNIGWENPFIRNSETQTMSWTDIFVSVSVGHFCSGNNCVVHVVFIT
jgi:hypothetical protein